MTDLLGDTLWAMNRILNPEPLAQCACGHEYFEIPEDYTVTDEGTVFLCEACDEVIRLEPKKGSVA